MTTLDKIYQQKSLLKSADVKNFRVTNKVDFVIKNKYSQFLKSNK